MLLIPRSFNSRAREGRDSRHSRTVMPACAFQFTRPRGARPYKPLRELIFVVVSIHAPARGATIPVHKTVSGCTGFNSRAREGRDRSGQLGSVRARVSIHAPARGATLVKTHARTRDEFQFTRPRGARQLSIVADYPADGFNSRAREGRDISYHGQVVMSRGFNSRAREGRDANTRVSAAWFGRFNSRAREGRDKSVSNSIRFLRVSIHAPARGATGIEYPYLPLKYVSIHAPARGATGI